MILSILDEDVLEYIAGHIVRQGNSYWAGAVCAAFRNAIRAFARSDKSVTMILKNGVPMTRISTCFESLKMLHHAVTVPNSCKIIRSNPHALMYNSLTPSADGEHRFTSFAKVHAFKRGSLDVINYMSPDWLSNKDNKPLAYACAAGRCVLLEKIKQFNGNNFDNALHTFATAPTSDIIEFFNLYVFFPAIKYGTTSTLEWLFTCLETIDDNGLWRELIGNSYTKHIGPVTVKMIDMAVESRHANKILTYLVHELVPLVLKPKEHNLRTLFSLTFSLVALVLAAVSGNERSHVEAWKWLKNSSSSAYEVWHRLETMGSQNTEAFMPTHRIDSRSVLYSMMSAISADVYKWQRNEIEYADGWLYEILRSERFGLPRIRVINGLTEGENLPICALFAMGTLTQARESMFAISPYAAARVDCMLHWWCYSEAHREILNIVPTSSWRLRAYCEIKTFFATVEEFFDRIDEVPAKHRDETLSWMQKVHVPSLLRLILTDSQPHWRFAIKCVSSRLSGGFGGRGTQLSFAEKQEFAMLLAASTLPKTVRGFPMLMRRAGFVPIAS